MFREIKNDNELYAIIISNKFDEKGVHFFTPNSFSQQLAYMQHPKGKKIAAHVHNPVKREVVYTQEVLFIKKGKLRVDFFNDNREYFESHILAQGDVILLAKGGHGFEVIEDVEMFEVKQGPYAGENDKTKFESKINRLNLK